jgi:hypothetical protein
MGKQRKHIRHSKYGKPFVAGKRTPLLEEYNDKKMKIWIILQDGVMVDYCENEKEVQIAEENVKRMGLRGYEFEEVEVVLIAENCEDEEEGGRFDIVKDIKTGEYFSLGGHSWDNPITSLSEEEVKRILRKCKKIKSNEEY